ncbi:MAG: Hsp20/alpha crystallin family protein [Candidatus Odinarchaeota archaeon]
MAIQIWRPFEELINFGDEFDRLFDIFGYGKRIISPLTDISETDKEIIVRSDLPGVKKDEIVVEATADHVIIKSEFKEEKEKKNDSGKVLYKERHVREFFRKIAFSTPVDPNKAKTSLKDGILTIRFPKVEPEKAVKLLLK